MDTYLTYLDQFRYIVGILLTLLMLCHGILTPRSGYRRRLLLCSGTAIAAVMSYVPLIRLLQKNHINLILFSMVYWSLISLIPILMTRLCWDVGWAGALFRSLLCIAVENFIHTFLHYFLTMQLFPSFPADHPAVYFILLAAAYFLFYLAGWKVLRKRVLRDESRLYQNDRQSALAFLYAYASFFILISACKAFFEWMIQPLEQSETYFSLFLYIRYFLIVILLLFSIAFTSILVFSYQLITLQNEKQVVLQMMKDRRSQYEFSRENIEMINRKAHDLKHQLRALEQVSDEERRKQIREARKAIDFYDAVVKTGNEALDTILTEKSVYCRNRDIRLSCMVQSCLLERLNLVDLYTLLGNALDNAIEGADRLKDPEKKTISLTIKDQNQMLFIQVENYYEGSLRLENGLPVTTKQDSFSHGIGTRSIRAIAERYKGSVMIRTEDQIFSLEILIPF